jgi:hypothetical protein
LHGVTRFALVLGVVACGHAAPRGAPLPDDPSPATRPTNPQALCTKLVADNAQALRDAPADLMARADSSRVTALAALLATCAAGRDGAWTFALDEVSEGPDGLGYPASQYTSIGDSQSAFARLALTYHFLDGRVSAVKPSVFGMADDPKLCAKPPCDVMNFTLASYNVFETMVAPPFDYDRDGTPEVVLHLVRGGLGEDPGEETWTVWTIAGGQIASYAPLAHAAISNVTDADADGRPDFVITTPYDHVLQFPYMDGCMTQPIQLPLLLHSIEGGSFSSVDAAAVVYARATCAKWLALPLADVATAEDGYRWAACQRMAGRSEPDVLRAYAAACPVVTPSTCGGLPLCTNDELFRTAAAVAPPLHFH